MNKLEDAMNVIESTFPVDKHRPLAYNNSVRLVKEQLQKQELALQNIKQAIVDFTNGSIVGFDCIERIGEVIDCFYDSKDV